jgi:hypothetical protein
MPSRKLVALSAAAPWLAVEWNIPDLIAEQIVRGVLQGGECFVRGRGRYDRGLRNISKEIGPTLWPNLLLSREFYDVEINWKDLVEYGRDLVPPGYEPFVSAAKKARPAKPTDDDKRAATAYVTGLLRSDRKMSRDDAWRACGEKFAALSERAFFRRIWPDAREGAGLPRNAPPGPPAGRKR